MAYETPVFMRDLNSQAQREFLNSWKLKRKKELLDAYEKEQDIQVGHYSKEEKIVD